VTPINVATNTAGTPIKVSGEPVAMAVAPDGKTSYVINGFPSTTLTPVDLATNTPGNSIKLSVDPEAIAMAPQGKTVYLTIATGTGTPGNFRSAFTIAPDGKTAYVTIY
jgi:DNA-binding beta-propeller fold protein YncE